MSGQQFSAAAEFYIYYACLNKAKYCFGFMLPKGHIVVVGGGGGGGGVCVCVGRQVCVPVCACMRACVHVCACMHACMWCL